MAAAPVDTDGTASGIADLVVETISKVAEKFEGRKKQKAAAEVDAEDVIEAVIEEEEEK